MAVAMGCRHSSSLRGGGPSFTSRGIITAGALSFLRRSLLLILIISTTTVVAARPGVVTAQQRHPTRIRVRAGDDGSLII